MQGDRGRSRSLPAVLADSRNGPFIQGADNKNHLSACVRPSGALRCKETGESFLGVSKNIPAEFNGLRVKRSSKSAPVRSMPREVQLTTI